MGEYLNEGGRERKGEGEGEMQGKRPITDKGEGKMSRREGKGKRERNDRREGERRREM